MAEEVILLFIGTERGITILRSEDGRAWRQLREGLEGKDVSSVAVDPTDMSKIYASAFGHGVYLSEDGGSTWREVNSGLTTREVWAIYVGTSDGTRVIYAGTEPARLFRSIDGESWSELNQLRKLPEAKGWRSPWGEADLSSIMLEPDGGRLYVGIEQGGVFGSDDGGRSWRALNAGLHRDVHCLALHPLEPGTLYAATGGGVFRSDDRGGVWKGVSEGLPYSYVRAMTLHPKLGTVYAVPMSGPYGGDTAIFRSDDRGESWQRLRGGLPEPSNCVVERKALTADGLKPCGVYAGTSDGEVFSLDEDDTWARLVGDLPSIRALAISRA